VLNLCWDLLYVNKTEFYDNSVVDDVIMSGTEEAQVYMVAIF
jgi:hypothetical protein